ncbi:phosphodiester glycosidase family protein [Acholeplasma hippikon]|uniref:Exopolysaccharide biosynthesis protein related to N-acetylglucosamine-1-phosphodiester alpha-N-acetylglucosaminidase n=1 Tax=Acholeplasma hippikon TaxID=264636 RepID=A0A449BKA0_9MOLU|nr:phosphodiester glycosidase family protein [Acholeplasma hippikon]VEU82823.1 Exopolysaccharide biosynthesis protein related to N-acetylglucosamine-1-phosphodiester alpha-N-acetylglucosaminidase [Acholeplasma hippikon]
MKKLFIAIFLAFFAIISVAPYVHAADEFVLEYVSRENVYYDGIRQIKAVANMSLNGDKQPQVFSYIGVNTKTTPYKVIASDGYSPYTYSMQPLTYHVENTMNKYSQLHVAGGVNADFYDINNTGRPSNIHVTNFEVINKGSTNQTAAGFLDDGSVVFGKPTFLGQHLNILNADKELKQRIKINKTNALPASDIELAVFYDSYKLEIPAGLPKVIVKSSDIKVAGSTVQYAKGAMLQRTTEAYTVKEREFVLVGKALQDENLITSTDQIIVQELLGNGFENTRFAIGMGDALVKGGVVQTTFNHSSAPTRNPRTGMGVLADGTIFFVVVDGRDGASGRVGLKLNEFAHLMKALNAVEAYNLDGGGSSTMLLRDAETLELKTLNQLSDGRMRSISNGLLFVKGDYEPVFTPIPYPDTRDKFNAPTGVYVDDEGVLHFVGNNEHASYVLKINGRETYLTKESMSLLLNAGSYEIQVKVKGDGTTASSDYSEVFTYNIHKQDVQKILDLMRQLA